MRDTVPARGRGHLPQQTLTKADDAFGLRGWPRLWRDEGSFSDEEIGAWERATTQPVVYALLYFVVAATKP